MPPLPVLIDTHGVPLRRSSAFEAGGRNSKALAAWNPFNYSADAALLPERDAIAARVHDIARNDGWASAGLQRHIDNVIGARFQLRAMPDWRALGQTAEWAQEWAQGVEARWRGYAEDPDFFCDAARQRAMVGLFGMMFRHRFMDGENTTLLLWLPERGGAYATTVQVVDPDRLSNPFDKPDSEFMRGGVEIDTFGSAFRYHFRKTHPGDILGIGTIGRRFQWEAVDRETPFGRRIVIHDFDADRAGQTRGRSRMTPILKKLRMLGRYDEAELQAAVVNSIFAAFITSPFDHEALIEMLSADKLDPYNDARATYYKDRRLVAPDGVQISTLFPGEQVQFPSAAHPNTAQAVFVETALRNIATGLDLSYEQLSMDWSKTNYSSARAALLEVWKGFMTRRAAFAEQSCRQVYAAWLEEDIDQGNTEIPPGAPDFQEAKAAFTRCKWIGPGRGWVDPVREAQGAQMRIEMGISTLADEAAEQGYDWEEQLEQRKREIDRMTALDIPIPDAFGAAAAALAPPAPAAPQEEPPA